MRKDSTRVTVDIPTIDHKKLKMLAAYHGKSMRELFVELIEQGLESYQPCSKDHTPNAATKKALNDALNKKNSMQAESVQDLFDQLDQ